MLGVKEIRYLNLLSSVVRRRHWHKRFGRRIIGFSVQIEILAKEQWRPVVRYDTAHGFAHRDMLSPKGTLEKTPLFMHTFNEALDFAEADLRNNWKIYVERYLKEMEK